MMRNLTFVMTGMAMVLAVHKAAALSSYVSRVPNGSALSCATCHVDGVPPDLNAFGNDFSATHAWSAALAAKDSDGDGFSNGQELGDPKGVWTSGSSLPIPGAQVSAPGDATSTPALTPPPISLASPASGATLTAPFLGPIVASTTLPAAAITKIEFYSGSTLLGSVTGAPYTLPVNLPSGSYSLTARAINYLGASNTSSAAQITVNPAGNAPTITSQPSSQAVMAGGTVSFSVVASGTAPLSYQWKLKSTNVGGATAATLTLTNTPLSSAGSYQCAVTNASGSALSQPAQLTVTRSTPTLASVPRLTNGSLVLSGAGFSGHGPIVFYVSTNLTNWTPLGTNPPSLGASVLTNSISSNSPAGFYRAVEN